MKVKNMVNANGNTSPNQFIITDNGQKTFQSYDSLIATYDSESRTLKVYPHWDYSKTTMKFFKQFIENETCFEYGTKSKFEKLMDDSPRILYIDRY